MSDSACWADPLGRIERIELAGKLSRACIRSFHVGTTTPDGRCRCTSRQVSHAHLAIAGECSELRIDVTERAEVAR